MKPTGFGTMLAISTGVKKFNSNLGDEYHGGHEKVSDQQQHFKEVNQEGQPESCCASNYRGQDGNRCGDGQEI